MPAPSRRLSLATSPAAQRAARRNRIRRMSVDAAFDILNDARHEAEKATADYTEAMTACAAQPLVREAMIRLRLAKKQVAHRVHLGSWTRQDHFEEMMQDARAEYPQEETAYAPD